MIKRKRNNKGCYIILSILFALVLFFLQGEQRVFALSIEEENRLGQKFLAEIEQHYELVDDDYANDYINNLGQYLLKSLETKPFTFRFHIIKDNELNAFAAPGGHIFLYTGLIDMMNIDELAAIICHELGHVSARHLSERIEQGKKIGLATLAGILAGSLLGGAAAEALITGSVAAGVQTQLNYSRDDERQADQLSVKYMEKTGFDAACMISALTKLQSASLSGVSNTPPYLLTHPVSTERMANIESMLSVHKRLGVSEGADKYRDSYPLFKTILRAKYSDTHDVERLFDMELEKDPDSPLAHFGLGIILQERAEYTGAIEQFQKALKGLPDGIPVLRYLGEAYQQKGQDQEAIRVFEKVLKIDDLDKPTLFLLGLSYQNLENYSRAADIFERLASMEPVKDEVFYNLGISLGRQERLGLAHYYFGVYFKRLHEGQKAEFHFQKALEMSGNDPSLMKRIRKAQGEGRNGEKEER